MDKALKEILAKLSPEERHELIARLSSEKTSETLIDKATYSSRKTDLEEEEAVERVYPASLQQRYFHDLETFSGENDAIVVRLPFRCRGPFDLEAFEHAVSLLVERHEIYRTVYRQTDVGLEAVILKHLKPAIDFRSSGGETEEELIDQLVEASSKRWDLEKESPLRFAILQLNDDEHILLFAFHHITCDGASWNLFSDELGAILKAGNTDPQLSPVKNDNQFSAYTERQADRLRGKRNFGFWKGRLHGLPAPPLPAKEPEPPNSPSKANTVYRSLPTDLWNHSVKLAQDWHSTPHNLLMAAFHAWHFRYLNASDVAIGTPIDARFLSGDEAVHGCAVYMLPIRQQMSSEMTFSQLQAGVQVEMLEAMEHAEVNLFELAEQEDRQDPFFTAIFQVRNLQSDLPELFPGTSVERLRVSRSPLHVPLLLQVHLDKGNLALSLAFDPRLTSVVAAERFLKSFQVLLENLLDAPENPLASHPLVDSQDHQLLTDTWAQNIREYPRESSIPSLFCEIATAFPDRPALLYDGKEVSYGELFRQAKQLAEVLVERGIGPGQHVGVYMERSADLIVSLIAILHTGSAYVPLDPDYPSTRIRFIVDDAEASVVLTHQACFARLRAFDLKIWLLEDLQEEKLEATENRIPEAAPLDAAYLMYTSGTTGRPKGSLVPHRGIVRLVKGTDYVCLGPEDTFLLLASPSFDAATFEIWAPLLNGGKLVIMPPGTPSLSEIGEVIKNSGVTTLWLTARLFDTIIDEAPDILRPIRQLLVGGETLSPNHVARCKKALPDLTLINGYGPTENTTFSCCYRIPEDPPSDKPIPIGRPIANSEAYILDLHLQPVPPGAIGELFLGGDGLSLGYWKRAELNDEVFVKNPFTADPKALLYRTGDLARYLPDGNIEFIGRHDQQVKIRGFRVELAEVETLLEKSPAIDRCCALLMEDDGNKAIAVAVVPSNALSSESALTKAKQYSAKNLPHYLQPERWLAVDSLPLTQNGKLDRDDLQKRFAEVEVSASPMVDPQPGIETQLLEIWQRLFQSNRISTDDNFFSIGGDSLKAMRLASEIERQLKRHLPLAEIFRNPTIQTLGSFLGGTRDGIKSTVITLRNGGQKKQGLFILHGWGGEVFAQTSFMDNIPEGFPVYGVQAVEHSGEDERLTSFEEMAKRYARDIVEQQPEGPYHLCGYSLGGMIAYETARQLYLGGYEIGHLIVLDTHPKNLPWYLQVRVQMGQLVIRLFHHLVQIITAKGGFSWRYIKGRINALRLRIGLLKLPYAVPDDVAEIELAVKTDYYAILNDRFIPIPFPIKTTVFRAQGAMTGLGVFWRYLSKNNVVLEDVPSSHNEMLRSPELARRVGELVKE